MVVHGLHVYPPSPDHNLNLQTQILNFTMTIFDTGAGRKTASNFLTSVMADKICSTIAKSKRNREEKKIAKALEMKMEDLYIEELHIDHMHR